MFLRGGLYRSIENSRYCHLLKQAQHRACLHQPLSYQQTTQTLQIPTSIEVAVRSVTTVLANKSVLVPCSDGIAMRTGFRRKARIHENHFDTRSTGFVHYFLLKLPEGPAVQACTNLLPGLDSLGGCP